MKFVAPRIVDIVKDVTGSDLQTRISAHAYYRYIQVDEMILRQDSVLALLKSLSGDDAGSKGLGILHLDDIRFHIATTEELMVLIRAGSNFVKNANKPACFRVFTFYSSAKKFLGEQNAALVDHRTVSASKFVEFPTTSMSRSRTMSMLLLQIFFSCMHLHRYVQRDRNGA